MITLVTSCTSALARFFLHNIFPFVLLVLYVQACLQPFCKQISSLTTEALPCVVTQRWVFLARGSSTLVYFNLYKISLKFKSLLNYCLY